MKWFVLFLFCSLTASGATYYVATDGDNGNDGSETTPWLTIEYGFQNLVAGDTLLVQPGTYDRDTYTISSTDGSDSNRITVRANGEAIITTIGFAIENPYWTVDGFTFSNVSQNFKVPANVVVGTNAHYTIIQNNTIRDCTATHGFWMLTQDEQTPQVISNPQDSAHDCLFTNNWLSNVFGGQCFFISGSNNLVVNNQMKRIRSGDGFIFHGCSNVFRQNIIWSGDNPPGGLHPDIMQTYGTDGNTTAPYLPTYGNTFEQCQFWDWQGALGQMTVDDPLTNSATPLRVDGPLVRNCLYVRCGPTNGSVSSLDCPNTRFINNTFIQCGTWPDSSGQVLNFSYYDTSVLTPTWRGQATNSLVINNAFVGCGQHSGSGWYLQEYHDYPSNATDLVADYNLVLNWDGTTWGTKTGFSEAHGVNTGADPMLVSFSGNNFRPMLTSPLINAGTDMSLYVSNAFDGTARPMDGAFDIGAFEFDPSLLVRFDFDESIAGRMLDVTGYGHDGVQFDGTNWISLTAGPRGGNAGLWTVVGIITNDPPQIYQLSQYAGITNISGIDVLTNGTISVWVQWATNTERWDTIFDCGYPTFSAWDGSLTTNSWAIHYGRPDLGEPNLIPVGPVFKIYGDTLTNDLGHPSLLIQWTEPRDGTTWYHLALTWDAGSNTIVQYENGLPLSTNALGVPWLRISGSPRMDQEPFTITPWLSVGAEAHDGTPQWGDDRYPNSGFFKGRMDDLRIYNRALSASEIQRLYVTYEIFPPHIGSVVRPRLTDVTDILQGQQSVQICWDTESDTTYQVEYRTGLVTGTWTALGAPVQGSGGTQCIVDSPVGQSRQFYRIRVLP